MKKWKIAKAQTKTLHYIVKMGEDGWEPFAIDPDGYMWFRRPKD